MSSMRYRTRIPLRLLLAPVGMTAVVATLSAVAYAAQTADSGQLAATTRDSSPAAFSAFPGTIPKPADVIGFTPGDDRKLASWAQITNYFKKLSLASDRVKVEDLGKTTLGRPFLLAIISSPENLARIDRFKEIQRRLADPRTISGGDDEAEKLIAEGRTIVLIT